MAIKNVSSLCFKPSPTKGKKGKKKTETSEAAETVSTCTLQPLYKTVCYNTVLDITLFKDGSQKCTDYIEK